eukprot:SAG11_NODE_2405_length_3397_cov_28.336162_3_plen_240_part_00
MDADPGWPEATLEYVERACVSAAGQAIDPPVAVWLAAARKGALALHAARIKARRIHAKKVAQWKETELCSATAPLTPAARAPPGRPTRLEYDVVVPQAAPAPPEASDAAAGTGVDEDADWLNFKDSGPKLCLSEVRVPDGLLPRCCVCYATLHAEGVCSQCAELFGTPEATQDGREATPELDSDGGGSDEAGEAGSAQIAAREARRMRRAAGTPASLPRLRRPGRGPGHSSQSGRRDGT